MQERGPRRKEGVSTFDNCAVIGAERDMEASAPRERVGEAGRAIGDGWGRERVW